VEDSSGPSFQGSKTVIKDDMATAWVGAWCYPYGTHTILTGILCDACGEPTAGDSSKRSSEVWF
jgi:hypothetical protein